MKKEIEIAISPADINDKNIINNTAARLLKINKAELTALSILKRSVDARSKFPVYRLKVLAYINENPVAEQNLISYSPVTSGKKIVIVGFGPAGMFAALKLIELNIKPIIFERGKDVQARRRDLKAIQQDHFVNPDSNYCFGEGGAGTYSDGKLYTRSTKRGDVNKILNVLVMHGADKDIEIDAHPHIGSNNLPKVVSAIRETILRCGGEIHFESKVTDLIVSNESVKGVIAGGNEFPAESVILATGHSARDIYHLLNNKNIKIESKPFALGVRIEHPQQLINSLQYRSEDITNLPPASYNLACDVEGRGVYSFCMCPGGIIVPAATDNGEIVVNGMSLSKRNSPFANAGFVVAVNENDYAGYGHENPLAALMFQQSIEQKAFEYAKHTQSAPAQRAVDFVNDVVSTKLNDTSYIPGLTSAPLKEILPSFITKGIKEALVLFDNKKKGYFTNEAQLVGVESRTSSPIRIPRDENYSHILIKGLYPCGEGAGYAGGIVSAAIDGDNCAARIAAILT